MQSKKGERQTIKTEAVKVNHEKKIHHFFLRFYLS